LLPSTTERWYPYRKLLRLRLSSLQHRWTSWTTI
jgi:hypothetical protein